MSRGRRHHPGAVSHPAPATAAATITRPGGGSYPGRRDRRGCTVTRPDGSLLELVPSLELRRHSPDGSEWGYHASGPSHLALRCCSTTPGTGRRPCTGTSLSSMTRWLAGVLQSGTISPSGCRGVPAAVSVPLEDSDVRHQPGATPRHLVCLGDLRAAKIPATVAVGIEAAAAEYGADPEKIARRAIEPGLPAVLGELQHLRQLAAAWDRPPAAREPLETRT